jgi:signal transduction histidine kinase
LYALRLQEESLPHGIVAIVKLVGTFEAATGITVTSNFTNTPVHLPKGTENALYHLVQECMTNSFRHGKATAIDIMTSVDDSAIQVVISDNGLGSSRVQEGIGLQGMSERIGRLGGKVAYENTPHGFVVKAALPWKGLT